MGLKRRSRYGMAACLLGANAPDIDVFAPLFLDVQGIQFHRGPVHGVFAWPVLAAGIVAILWALDRWRPAKGGDLPFRAGALFVVAFLAVLTHPFLDWLTTYAIAIFAPASWRWYSGNAIFIVDWVYWLLMIPAIAWSAWRWRRHRLHPGRPARVAGVLMLAYIAFNLGLSARVEAATSQVLRARGVEPTLVVASPPPITFWRRGIAWRSADRFGSGSFDLQHGLSVSGEAAPLDLDDRRLLEAKRRDPHIRAFLVWSRMPIVVTIDGHRYLTDQRFYGNALRPVRNRVGRTPFLIPLDNPHPSS